MIHFTADVLGEQTINRAFNRVEQFITDFRNIWPAVTTEFYNIETEQFQSEGARGVTGRFAPLSSPYKKFKEIHFPGKPILEATGALRESLTSPDGLDSILRPGRDELVIGSGLPYAVFHQRGAGRLPRRPPIAMNETSKRRIQKAIQSKLVELTRKAGFEVREEAA